MGRPAGDWRNLLGITVLLVAVGVGTAPIGLVYLPIQGLIGALPCGFLAGYLWWQDRVDRGRRPAEARRDGIWTLELAAAATVAALGIVAVYAMSSVVVVAALLADGYLSFLAGLTYRQHLLRRGRAPRWRFLHVASSGEGRQDG